MFAPKVAKPQPKIAEGSANTLAPKPSMLAGHRLGRDPADQALFLQRAIGNQAMLDSPSRRLSDLPAKGPADRQEPETVAENMTAREALRVPSWDFSKIALFSPGRTNRAQPLSVSGARPGVMQPKLAIGPVDDPLEREADAIADQMTRMSDNKDETAQKLQIKPRAASNAPPLGEAPGIVHEVLRSSGQPLDKPTRTRFESRLGHDFSQVRIHTGPRAAESAKSLNALAYTAGPNVVFGLSAAVNRQRLLAHELVHVLQQSSGKSSFLQRQESAEGESLPGGPGMERTVPEGTKRPPRANSPEAVREEAEYVGSQWGLRLADRDIALDTMQAKYGGSSLWDRMTAKDKQSFAEEVKERFAKIPELPQYSEPGLAEAQESGFMSGMQERYSLEKFVNFLVKLGRDLAIYIFSGLAAGGIKIPQVIARALMRTELAETAALARSIVAQLVKSGQRVVINIGGEGEVAGAINLNIQKRLNVPIENFIESDAANIGDIFESNSIDEIVSNRLPPNTLDWDRLIPGASKVLKPGSRLLIRFQGTGQDGAKIMPLLRQYGFREINDWGGSGAIFEAVK